MAQPQRKTGSCRRFLHALRQIQRRRQSKQQQQQVPPGRAIEDIEMQAVGDVHAILGEMSPKSRRRYRERYLDTLRDVAQISAEAEKKHQEELKGQVAAAGSRAYRYPQMIHGWTTQSPAHEAMGGLEPRRDPHKTAVFRDYDQITRKLRDHAPHHQVLDDEDTARLRNIGIEFGQRIGGGNYGSVWEATIEDEHGTPIPLVVKRLAMADFRQKVAGFTPFEILLTIIIEMKAADLLIKNTHPNIVGCRLIWRIYQHETQFPDPITLLLFLERCSTDLNEVIEDTIPNTLLTEDDAQKLFVQIGNAVQHIHQLGMAHRDIKPENIMLMKHPFQAMGKFLLGDFGISKIFDDPNDMSTNEDRGTPMYKPPEMLNQTPTWNPPFNAARQDVYSLGATVLMSMVGYGPYSQHLHTGVPVPQYAHYDELCERFWKPMLDQSDYGYIGMYMSKESVDFFHQVCSGDKHSRPFAGEALALPWAREWKYDSGFVRLSFL